MRYRTVVVDPPWPYRKSSGGYAWRDGTSGQTRRTVTYETLSLEQIASLGVREVAADDAHLFLWTTQRFLLDVKPIVRAWGFAYSCTLVWAKEPHGWGPGGLFQSHVEFIVYARRGRPPERVKRGITPQVYRWSRVGQPKDCHSVKPPQFFDLVESICEGPFVEVFSRSARLGWSVAGDEAIGDEVEVPGVRRSRLSADAA